MPVPAVVPRTASLGLRVAALLSFLPPLLTRLVLGYAFFLTGRGKIENFSNTVSFFTDLGIPMPELNAAFVSRLEYYGGMLLIVGLLTRIAAGLLGPAACAGPDRPRTAGPGVRNAHAMAYDPSIGRVVLFGGADAASVRGDTWAWDGDRQRWAPMAGIPWCANAPGSRSTTSARRSMSCG